MNSGLFNEGTSRIPNMNASKALLETIHTPTLYVLGGETDIAYKNGMDDFARIGHVPVFVATSSASGMAARTGSPTVARPRRLSSRG